LIVILTASLGSLFTSSAVNSPWYQTIKPSITPPNYVFPIAWGILFFMIALSLYFAWTNAKKRPETKFPARRKLTSFLAKQKKIVAAVFGINLVLNVLWSALYFGMKNPLLGFCDIVLLWISILAMIIALWKIDRISSYLLVPYFLWVSFASVLNFLSIR